MSISENIQKIRGQIEACAERCGRSPYEVRLMAVSKFHSAKEVEDAVAAGLSLFGENRVQEAAAKFPPLLAKYPQIELHMIGSLQRNKVKDIVKIAACIQSVDRLELVAEIEKQAAKIGKVMDVLLELHTGEESKSGFAGEDELEAALQMLEGCPHVRARGFMTMAPFTADEAAVRASFAKLAAAAQKMRAKFPQLGLEELSMGMSGDFCAAIEGGSTMVRIGTAIFGERGKVLQ